MTPAPGFRYVTVSVEPFVVLVEEPVLAGARLGDGRRLPAPEGKVDCRCRGRPDRDPPLRRHEHRVQVARILGHGQPGRERGRRLQARGEHRQAGVVGAARADVVHVVVRLERVADGRRIRERGRHAQQAVSGCVVPTGGADVARRAAHHLEELTRVEVRPGRPDPRGRAGHERGREAGAVLRVPRLVQGGRDRDVLARCGEVDVAGAARERRHPILLVGRCDGEDVRRAGGERELVARVAVIPRRRDDEHSLPDRGGQRLRDRDLRPVRAEAEVDHARAPVGGGHDPRHDLARDELGARPGRRVPRLQEGFRIDADDADAVLGGADDRRHGRPVNAAERLWLLRVQREQICPPRELRVRELDPRVDDGDGLAGHGRHEPGDPDSRAPPLGGDERIDEVGDGKRPGRPVGNGETDGPAGAQPGHDPHRCPIVERVEPQARRDGPGAGLPQRGSGVAGGNGRRAKLDERPPSARRRAA